MVTGDRVGVLNEGGWGGDWSGHAMHVATLALLLASSAHFAADGAAAPPASWPADLADGADTPLAIIADLVLSGLETSNASAIPGSGGRLLLEKAPLSQAHAPHYQRPSRPTQSSHFFRSSTPQRPDQRQFVQPVNMRCACALASSPLCSNASEGWQAAP